jgi:outer membrane protein
MPTVRVSSVRVRSLSLCLILGLVLGLGPGLGPSLRPSLKPDLGLGGVRIPSALAEDMRANASASIVSGADAITAAKGKLPSPVIALIDLQRILQESLAAQSVQKQLASRRAKFQAEIEGEENELRQSEQDLGKLRGQLASETYNDREQHLRQRFLTVERHVQARRKVLDQTFSDSMNDVRASLLEIVGEVAHAHDANLVLIKQQALWGDQPLDVTDEVLSRLNRKLPSVTVKTAPDVIP